MSSLDMLNHGFDRSTNFDVTATSLTALNGQLATETDGLCSLLWQALYNGDAMGPIVQLRVIESCIDSLSILAGTIGLEELSEPVSELGLLLQAQDSQLDEIEACIGRITRSAHWSREVVLDQGCEAST